MQQQARRLRVGEVTLLERELAEIEASAYLRRLAPEVVSVAEGRAEVRLPFADELSNRAGSLHGGAIASLMLVGAALASASSQHPRGDVRGRPLAMAASFLAPPRRQAITAVARVRHRGSDTVHLGAEVATADGRPIALGTLVQRIYPGSQGALESSAVRAVEATAAREAAGARGSAVSGSPYMRAAGLEVLDTFGDWTCAAMPLAANEGVTGSVHEGAIVGLVDTCGAFCAYSQGGVAREKGGVTVAIHASFGERSDGDVRGGGRLLSRTGPSFSSEVQVWNTSSGAITASALVLYRILS